MDIAVIGSNNFDLITYITRMPVEGETIEAPDFRMGFGGKGSNQAVAAARLGSEVLMVTCVGNDLFAESTIQNYRNNGIDTRYVKQVEGSSGVAPIFVDPQAHNSVIIVKGANNALTPEDLEATADDIAQCKLIVLQLEIHLDTVRAAIDLGNRLGVPVLLNPAPASTELELDWVAKCRYFMPNETELALLTGMPVETVEQIRAAARVLLESGVEHVIVTMGERGVLWLSSSGDELRIPQVPVDAVDTVGAGDAFIWCFAHGIASGWSIEEALRTANAYAAHSVTGHGTQSSYASAAEFEQWRAAQQT